MKIESIKWKQNVPNKGIEATKAHAALEEIRKGNNGLTDDAIVQAAKPKSHALHKWFEWDDSQAAKEHRRSQARQLIRSLEVVYTEAPDIKTRVYEVEQKVRPQDPGRTVYTTAEEVLANPESRDRLIAEAIRSAMQFRRRFKMLHELDAVMQAIDKAVAELGSESVC
jgi:tRNA A37 N6-isopentenylltransferase MiaA